MLAGEYAVLDGGRALAAAIDGTFSVQCSALPSLTPNEKTTITLESTLWSNPITFSCPGALPDNPHSLNFAKAAVAALGLWKTKPKKMMFKAYGNLAPSLGAGSSSALRLTTLASALRAATAASSSPNYSWDNAAVEFDVIERIALELQRESQPAASGYDLAVQRRGGVIEFCCGKSREIDSDTISKLAKSVVIMCGGDGAPTGSTMQSFMNWINASKRSQLMKLSETQVDAWIEVIEGDNRSIQYLINAVSAHRDFMANSPVFPDRVAKALAACDNDEKRWTWKPTGAGGEDSILLIGAEDALAQPVATLEGSGWKRSEMPFTKRGLQLC